MTWRPCVRTSAESSAMHSLIYAGYRFLYPSLGSAKGETRRKVFRASELIPGASWYAANCRCACAAFTPPKIRSHLHEPRLFEDCSGHALLLAFAAATDSLAPRTDDGGIAGGPAGQRDTATPRTGLTAMRAHQKRPQGKKTIPPMMPALPYRRFVCL